MKSSSRRRGWQIWCVVLLVIVALAAACSDSDDDSSTMSEEAADDGDFEASHPAGEAVDDATAEEPAAADEAEEGDGGGGLGVPAALQPTDVGRSIIFTASLTVVVDDVVAASAEALRAVEGLGGLLFAQETTGGANPRTVLTFKVAPDDFGRALELLGELGDLRNQSVSADDVTERLVDLESQIITAEASVERLRSFLADATDVNNVATLEQQLLERETRLELLRGQRRTIQNRVDLATIVLEIRRRVPEPELSVEETFVVGEGSCPGTDEIVVDEGREFAVCVLVENVGDTAIVDLEFRDFGLDLESDDFELVRGSIDRLEPAERATVRAFVVAERDVFSEVTVTGVLASDPDVTVSASDGHFVEVEESDALPGFVDGLGAAWDVVLTVIGVIVVAAGFALPLIWVPVVVWAVVRWWRRRRAHTRVED